MCDMRKIDWNERAANLLKSELKRHGLTYADLVEKLAKIGIAEKEVNVRNKLSRGTFTAAYFLQCLEAVGVKELRLT
jgi:3-mercaptopyruvate sulfurtransferase SseA